MNITNFKGALLFEWGPLAGHRLNFEAEACPNPSCECNYLTLNCSLGGPTLDSNRRRPVPVEMDLNKQRIENFSALKADPASADLAYAMAAEMDDEKWEELRHVYLHLKQYWTDGISASHRHRMALSQPRQRFGDPIIIFVMSFVAGHAFGNGVACWIIISEIYPTKVRGRGMSIATTALWLVGYAGNQMFPIMQKHLASAGTFGCSAPAHC